MLHKCVAYVTPTWSLLYTKMMLTLHLCNIQYISDTYEHKNTMPTLRKCDINIT